MSNNCTNPPADSLVAGTFLGTDCEGNIVGAGGSIATCADLQGVKDGVNGLDFATHEEVAAVDTKADAAQTKADEAKDTADTAQTTADTAETNAQTALDKSIVRVDADGDKREIVLTDDTKIPFFITDEPSAPPTYNDQKVIGFGVDGDNIVITMLDGTEHDLTRQEFADWLAAQDSAIATDQELADAIAGGSGNLQAQIDALQAQLDAINTDQATLFIRDTDLVLLNEDGTESPVPLADIDQTCLSSDEGNLLEWREDPVTGKLCQYFGIVAPPNLQNIYVDDLRGDDSVSLDDGGGTRAKPFKTLDHAFDLTPQDKSNTIHLNALNSYGQPQQYTMTKYAKVKSGATRSIVPYDEPLWDGADYDCIKGQTHIVSVYNSAEVIRPILKLGWKKARIAGSQKQITTPIIVETGAKLSLTAITVELTTPFYDTAAYPTTGIEGRVFLKGGGNVALKGCKIEDESPEETIFMIAGSGQKPLISFDNTDINSIRHQVGHKPFIFLSNTSASITTGFSTSFFSGSLVPCGDFDPNSLTALPDSMTEYLQRPNVIYGVVRSPNTGDPINVSTNFPL